MLPGSGGRSEVREGAAFATSTGASGPPSPLNKAPAVFLVPSRCCRLEDPGHPDSSRDLFCRQEEQKKKAPAQRPPGRPQQKPQGAWSEPEDWGAHLRVSPDPASLLWVSICDLLSCAGSCSLPRWAVAAAQASYVLFKPQFLHLNMYFFFYFVQVSQQTLAGGISVHR